MYNALTLRAFHEELAKSAGTIFKSLYKLPAASKPIQSTVSEAATKLKSRLGMIGDSRVSEVSKQLAARRKFKQRSELVDSLIARGINPYKSARV